MSESTVLKKNQKAASWGKTTSPGFCGFSIWAICKEWHKKINKEKHFREFVFWYVERSGRYAG